MGLVGKDPQQRAPNQAEGRVADFRAAVAGDHDDQLHRVVAVTRAGCAFLLECDDAHRVCGDGDLLDSAGPVLVGSYGPTFEVRHEGDGISAVGPISKVCAACETIANK